MKERVSDKINHVTAAALFLMVFLVFLFRRDQFGLHADHFLFVGMFYAGRLHFVKNGLFSLPYYTPSFGGGIPLYADPQSMYFSLPQWFFNLIPYPYVALKLSFVTCLALAYAGSYRLFRAFGASRWAATAGGLVFSLNGFIVSRWLVGHLTFHTYWIVPWVVYHALHICRHAGRRERVQRALWMAALASACIYAADINTILILMLLLVTLLASLAVVRRSATAPLPAMLYGVFLSLPLAALLSWSKASATIDYLKVFPRHAANNTMTIGNILRALGHGLFNPLLKVDSNVAGLGRWHEYSVYVGLGTLAALAVGAAAVFGTARSDEKPSLNSECALAVTWCLLTMLLAGYLMMGENTLWLLLKKAPLLSSHHVVNRYAGAIPLPLVGVAVLLVSMAARRSGRVMLLTCLMAAAVADVTAYELTNDFRKPSPMIHLAVRRQEKDLVVSRWIPQRGYQLLPYNIGDSYATSQQFQYDPTRSRVDPSMPPHAIHEDGTLNITDPVSLIYPDVTGRPPWSLLPVEGNEEKALNFLAYYDPGFYVPQRQHVANVLSLVAWAALALYALRRVTHAGPGKRPDSLPCAEHE